MTRIANTGLDQHFYLHGTTPVLGGFHPLSSFVRTEYCFHEGICCERPLTTRMVNTRNTRNSRDGTRPGSLALAGSRSRQPTPRVMTLIRCDHNSRRLLFDVSADKDDRYRLRVLRDGVGARGSIQFNRGWPRGCASGYGSVLADRVCCAEPWFVSSALAPQTASSYARRPTGRHRPSVPSAGR
jgi:hypothetical protein